MAKIDVHVNGERRELEEGAGIEDVLEGLGLEADDSAGVAVAVNDEVVRRKDWPNVHLDEGDRVEVITARQGG